MSFPHCIKCGCAVHVPHFGRTRGGRTDQVRRRRRRKRKAHLSPICRPSMVRQTRSLPSGSVRRAWSRFHRRMEDNRTACRRRVYSVSHGFLCSIIYSVFHSFIQLLNQSLMLFQTCHMVQIKPFINLLIDPPSTISHFFKGPTN